MSIKLKALGLSMIAALAISAVAVVNASANGAGHFVNDAPNGHALVSGSENATHQLELTIHGLNGGVVCDTASYSGTVAPPVETPNTVTSVTVSPSYASCHTTGSATNVPVDVNGCTYTFTAANEGEKETVNGTADLGCAGGGIVITHPACTVKVPGGQNGIAGVSYTTLLENNKHAITVEANVQFNVLFEGGACVLLGTGGHTGTLKGSATVKGTDTDGNPVNITAT